MTEIPVNGTKNAKTVEPDPHKWIKSTGIQSTRDVKVPTRLLDQVLGQEEAVRIVQKAAEQKRNLLLIGEPGTGKSMLAKAMAEILPAEKQKDTIIYHNTKNPNNPKVLTVEGGVGKKVIAKYDAKASKRVLAWRVFEYTVGLGTIAFGLVMWLVLKESILSFLFSTMIALLFLYFTGQNRPKKEFLVPKLLTEHSAEAGKVPYVDATGSHAGALLGDVRHDPFQSGGLETPPHQRVEEGAIHRANKGVLFIDEINVLRLPSQQALLTSMQEREYSISGQSQNSSGAMIRTEPIPTDFILVAAGNLDAVKPPEQNASGGMHPALRSRIRGYGYEVYVNSLMDDTQENRLKLAQFVAQEVIRDGRIPHFDADAIAEIIREAQRRSGRTGKLTLRLRELGGLVRTAGDFARSANADMVTLAHVRDAKISARSLENQIMEKEIENGTMGESIVRNSGSMIGLANAVCTVGTGDVGEPAGIIVPVEAAVVPSHSRHGGEFIIGPGLRGAPGASSKDARHSGGHNDDEGSSRSRASGVENVGAALKLLAGAKIADHDIHVDAMFGHSHATSEGISVAAAVAAVSALESVPVKLDVVLIGDVAVNGHLRPVAATLQRIEAAAVRGYKRAVIPKALESSLLVDEHVRAKIDIVHCETLAEALAIALDADASVTVALTGRLNETGVPR